MGAADQDADDDELPQFKRDAVGTLTPEQRKVADRAKGIADEGVPDAPDPNAPISAQHCSHGSHGSW